MNHATIGGLFRANRAFLIPYLFLLVICGVFMCLYPKPGIHIWINGHTSGKADIFFTVMTWFGDGIAVAIACLMFLLIRIRMGLLLLFSGLFAGVVTQVLKHTVFAHFDRPVKFFEGVYQLHLVPGVVNATSHSFPSGHSASAFALCFSLCILTTHKTLKFLLLVLASLVAFSRVYLSQHFLHDVYAGSILGVMAASGACLLLTRVRPFAGAAWMNRSFTGFKSPDA